MKQLVFLLCISACWAPLSARAAPAPPATCASLIKQFDEADKSAVPPDKLAQAKKEARHGHGLCGTGNIAAGMKALKEALQLIGITVE